MKNIAYIDGQNLHLGTIKCDTCSRKYKIPIKEIRFSDCRCGNAWKIDLKRFRIYLKKKYFVDIAYYFLGYFMEENIELYKKIQEAGFVVSFKEHNKYLESNKKGNVDIEIVFEIMKKLIDNHDFEKILLVSGDGDYKKLVDFLISKNKFEKILFPNKKFASSLYKQLRIKYFSSLEDIKLKIR